MCMYYLKVHVCRGGYDYMYPIPQKYTYGQKTIAYQTHDSCSLKIPKIAPVVGDFHTYMKEPMETIGLTPAAFHALLQHVGSV